MNTEEQRINFETLSEIFFMKFVCSDGAVMMFFEKKKRKRRKYASFTRCISI